MKVLVSGTRNTEDSAFIYHTLDRVVPEGNVCIIHGAARGADHYAEVWARMNQYDYRGYPAKWKKHGRSAGPRRNARMLAENPDIALVVAFPAPDSVGTLDMIQKAQRLGIEVLTFEVLTFEVGV